MTISTRPEASSPRTYQFPHFERITLDSGLEIVVAPVRKLPIVTALLLTDAGAGTEPLGRDGVANLTAQSLLEGTSELDGVAITERLERWGAAIAPAADWDVAMVGMTVLRPRLDDAMQLFADVVLDPAFPEREVERLKGERLAELLQLRTEPRGLADDAFERAVYMQGSRYALPEHGSTTGVTALDRAALVEFHRSRYRPDGSTLVLVGDLSVSDGVALGRRLFIDWIGAAPAMTPVDDRPARDTRAVHVVAKADAPQSELRVGHVGLPRHHPDYFPTLVMNAVLGGLFSSRINLNLREVHGYTYGAHSGFAWRRGAGPFEVSTAVKSDVTDAAAREILAEIDRIRTSAPAPAELSLATSYLDGVFPIKYETTDAIARALAALVVYRLPDDYFDRYRGRIRAVTADDVQRAAAAHLRPDMLQVVAVGDPSAIREPLAALGAGPVTVLDAEGVVVRG